MSTYTIVKSYKLYEGGTDSGQPIDDLGEHNCWDGSKIRVIPTKKQSSL